MPRSASQPEPTSLPLAASPPGNGVVIHCVLYNPDGPDDGNEVMTLLANETTEVTGWWIEEDEADNQLYLSDIYHSGQSYKVVNSGGAVWNNDGDTTFLYSVQGELLDTFSYIGGRVQTCR